MRATTFLAAWLMMAMPAAAGWQATTPQAAAAARDPVIAEALAATERMDAAILAHDADAFGACFAADGVVNSPYNNVATAAQAVGRLRGGAIDYSSLERFVEYAARRGDHEVVLMGEERVTPINKARFAGQVVRRRTTELWTRTAAGWKLALRQATIYAHDAPGAPPR